MPAGHFKPGMDAFRPPTSPIPWWLLNMSPDEWRELLRAHGYSQKAADSEADDLMDCKAKTTGETRIESDGKRFGFRKRRLGPPYQRAAPPTFINVGILKTARPSARRVGLGSFDAAAWTGWHHRCGDVYWRGEMAPWSGSSYHDHRSLARLQLTLRARPTSGFSLLSPHRAGASIRKGELYVHRRLHSLQPQADAQYL
jgi:hypothetical protein